VPALHWLIRRSAGGAPPAVLLHADQQPRRLPAPIETACYRLAQEALANAMRHARASRVDIEVVDHGDSLKLSIRDDGRGFNFPAALARAASGKSMGLLGMRERVSLAGGQLAINSRPGGGTEVCATFPLAAPAQDAAEGPRP
ncbi:MAG: sensor histidine kinase, partial [Pseudomonadota bacterium]